MNFVAILVFLFFSNCNSQLDASPQQKISFEVINHYPFTITTQKYLLIDTQAKMGAIFADIHKKSEGKRMAPIPTVLEGETYLVFKPVLKTSNDVEVKDIYLKNSTLYIVVKPFDDPQIKKTSRVSPNVMVKFLKKVTAKKVVINYN